MSTQNAQTQRVALMGASRGSGLESLLLLLQHTTIEVHCLVRNPDAFRATLNGRLASDASAGAAAAAAKYEAKGRLIIVKGDATVYADVEAFLAKASAQGGRLTHIVSSLGALPIMKGPSALFKPFQTAEPNICGNATKVLLSVLRNLQVEEMPHLVVVTTNGAVKRSYDTVPLLLKPLYGYYLRNAIADKLDMESQLYSAHGIQSTSYNVRSSTGATSENVPKLDASKLTILRAAIFTDGSARAKVRASTNGLSLKSAYTISRADVGLFIVDQVIRPDRPASSGPRMDVAYESGKGHEPGSCDAKILKDGSEWKQGIVLAY